MKFITPDRILEKAGAFKESRILLSAYELGLFTFIDKGMTTAEEIAEAAGTHIRSTERLLDALTAYGYLNKHENDYSNSEESATYLSGESEFYLKNLGHTGNLWHTWTGLTDSVRTGKPSHREEINHRGADWLRNFIDAMHSRGGASARRMKPLLDFDSGNRILDIGGGSGVFTAEFIRDQNNMTGVVFDLPNVVPITAEYIKMMGMEARIDVRAGNFMTDDLGSGFDMVLLSAIVHMNSYDENAKLIRRCADALNPGGQIVISDFVMDDNRIEPAAGAIFSINMLVGTEGGDTFTKKEITEWFNESGIIDVKFIDTDGNTSIAVGRKNLEG